MPDPRLVNEGRNTILDDLRSNTLQNLTITGDYAVAINGETVREGESFNLRSRPIQSFRLSNNDLDVACFMAPADGVYHKPQDALCVTQLGESDYLFAVADGVSGGESLLGQHSGEVSRQLLSHLQALKFQLIDRPLTNQDLVHGINSKRNDLAIDCRQLGWTTPDGPVANDTTLQVYRTKKLGNGDWEVTAISVGQEKDLGPQAYSNSTAGNFKFEGYSEGSGRILSKGSIKTTVVTIPAGSELVLGTDALKRMFVRPTGEPSTGIIFQAISKSKRQGSNGRDYVSTTDFSKIFSALTAKTRDDASLIHVKLY